MYLLIPLPKSPLFFLPIHLISVDLRLSPYFSLIFLYKNYHISFIYAIVDVPYFLLYRTSTILEFYFVINVFSFMTLNFSNIYPVHLSILSTASL